MSKITSGGGPGFKPANVGAAAIDIGSKMHMAAADPACAGTPVRALAPSRRTCMISRTGLKRVA